MKKNLIYILGAVLSLLLLFPLYYRDVVTVIIKLSAHNGTYVDVFYKPGAASAFVYGKSFAVEKDQTLILPIYKKSVSTVKVGIIQRFFKNRTTNVKSIEIIGKNKAFLDRPFELENKKEFVWDDFEPVKAQKIFYVSSFIFCLLSVSALFAAMRKSRTVRLLSAATVGYVGFALSCNLKFIHLYFPVVFIFWVLFVFYKRVFDDRSDRRFYPVLLFSGLVFGAVNVLSLNLFFSDSWMPVARHGVQWASALIGQAIFFYAVGISFFSWISHGRFFTPVQPASVFASAVDFYKLRTILCSFLIILLLWLPYHFIYYPGFFPWDSKQQLKTIFVYDDKWQRHPVFSSLLFALFFKIGSGLKDMNLGFYLYTAFQSCVGAVIFALCTDRIKQLGFNLY